jgi:ribose transport system permease protein
MRRQPWLFAALLSAALVVANVIAQPAFGRPGNWPAELATLAPLVLLATASTPSILSGGGGLDLSVGPLAVMCNVLLVHSLLAHGIDSAWLDVPILLAVGGAVGTVNGVLVTLGRYRPVIATLCSLFVLSGLLDKIGANELSAGHNWTSTLGSKVGPVPGALILMAVPAAVWLALGLTPYRRALYCVGGDDAAAYSAGVNISAVRIGAYALGGLLAAVAGIALTAVVQSSQAAAAPQYVLIGLTAVALGGTPLTGGRGGMFGSALGAVVLYLMQTLLSALGVTPDWLSVVYGAMLVASVLLGASVTRSSRRSLAASA